MLFYSFIVLTHPRGNASIALSSSFVVDQFELDPTQTECIEKKNEKKKSGC